MWPKKFKDYPDDTCLKHEQLSAGKGIIGCEMHEQMGWGQSHHIPLKPSKIGLMRRILYRLFGAPK